MIVPSFASLVARTRKVAVNPERLVLALDPGETTGWALFEGVDLKATGQLATKPVEVGGQLLIKKMADPRPDIVVYEEYRVYGWKADDHKWSPMHTSQLIGGIRLIATINGIRTHGQTAQVAKQFVTDEKLEHWGFWARGQKHARDAIRHGCYYILFNEEKVLAGQTNTPG